MTVGAGRGQDPPAARFAGRVAVVTGGASGIGAAVCRRLAERGRSSSSSRTSTRRALPGVADEIGGEAVPVDVSRARRGGRAVRRRRRPARPGRRRRAQRRASAHPTTARSWTSGSRRGGVSRTSTSPASTSGAARSCPTCSSAAAARSSTRRPPLRMMGAATSQISYTASKGGVLALSRELGVQFARVRRPGQRASPRGSWRRR